MTMLPCDPCPPERGYYDDTPGPLALRMKAEALGVPAETCDECGEVLDTQRESILGRAYVVRTCPRGCGSRREAL